MYFEKNDDSFSLIKFNIQILNMDFCIIQVIVLATIKFDIMIQYHQLIIIENKIQQLLKIIEDEIVFN